MDHAHWTVEVAEPVELRRESGSTLTIAAGSYGLRELDRTRYALLRDGRSVLVLWFSEVLSLTKAGRIRVGGDWPVLPHG